MIYISFDLSLNSTGYAILELEDGADKLEILDKGLIKAKSRETHHDKLKRHYEEFLRFQAQYPDAVILKEQLLFSPPKTASILAKVHGVCDLVFPKVQEMYPSTIKKIVTGDGSAKKDEVASSVVDYFGYDIDFSSDDESDALAIAIAHTIKKG